MSMSTNVFSFGFTIHNPQTRIQPASVQLQQFFKKPTCLNLSSSQTISRISPLVFGKSFNLGTTLYRNSRNLTVVCAKGYKMKTHKASAKRFRVTGTGKIVRRRAGKQHLLRKKNTKRRNRLSKTGFMNQEFTAQQNQCNQIEEPSPLGLKLKKSPSLLDLIQMKLSQSRNKVIDSGKRKNVKGVSNANDKLKASNFLASVLRIGSWEYVSRYEGDLVAKCYFAKHKLVWEVLEGGLKSKLEMQWSDIVAMKADCSDVNPGTLTLVLARQPAFFRETNPQPRKHTLWQASTDFTDGQASINRVHYIECPPGVLNKHYEKLIQCDTRLSMLSRQPENIMCSPYFEQKSAVFRSPEEPKTDESSQLPATDESSQLPATAKGSLSSSSSSLEQSPLVMQGLHPSMSMSDLMNHMGNCISEQLSSGNMPSDKALECHSMLENISQVLLSDTQNTSGFDEKSLMKKVNSLCCLLQDPSLTSGGQVDGGSHFETINNSHSFSYGIDDATHENANFKIGLSEEIFSKQEERGMQRKDSYADLLLNLPRIASLPKFLTGIAEVDR